MATNRNLFNDLLHFSLIQFLNPVRIRNRRRHLINTCYPSNTLGGRRWLGKVGELWTPIVLGHGSQNQCDVEDRRIRRPEGQENQKARRIGEPERKRNRFKAEKDDVRKLEIGWDFVLITIVP